MGRTLTFEQYKELRAKGLSPGQIKALAEADTTASAPSTSDAQAFTSALRSAPVGLPGSPNLLNVGQIADVMPVAGMAVGGMTGGPAGAAAGGAGGQALADLVTARAPASPQELALRLGTQAALGAGGELLAGAPGVVGKGAEKLAAWRRAVAAIKAGKAADVVSQVNAEMIPATEQAAGAAVARRSASARAASAAAQSAPPEAAATLKDVYDAVASSIEARTGKAVVNPKGLMNDVKSVLRDVLGRTRIFTGRETTFTPNDLHIGKRYLQGATTWSGAQLGRLKPDMVKSVATAFKDLAERAVPGLGDINAETQAAIGPARALERRAASPSLMPEMQALEAARRRMIAERVAQLPGPPVSFGIGAHGMTVYPSNVADFASGVGALLQNPVAQGWLGGGPANLSRLLLERFLQPQTGGD